MMNKTKYFEKKVVTITGGSSGIGLALAKRIVLFNPKAIILISHEEAKLHDAVIQLKKIAPNVEVELFVADIADSKSVRSACSKIISDFGAPDILINNAGYAHYLLFHEMTEDEVVRHANVNFIGAMRVVHAFLPAMRKAKRGQIVNIASIAGHMVMTPNLVYSAAKHGMIAWSEGLSVELASDDIHVQTISPGRVLTDFFRHESFKTRVSGSETWLTVSLKKVIDVSVMAIVKRKKLTIVPFYWSFIAWIIRAFPSVVKPLYFMLLHKRVARFRDSIICPVSGQKAEFYCQKNHASYYINKRNGVIFLSDMPSIHNMSEYADEQYQSGVYKDYLNAKELKILTANIRLDTINKYKPGKKMLDVGCSAGFFMQAAKARNYEVEGIEFAASAIVHASPSVKDKIVQGDVHRELDRWQQDVDWVSAFDIIEHMQDPVKFVSDIHKILKPTGLLVMSTPDTGHWLRRLMQSSWPMLQPLQHMVLFSRTAMENMLLAQGFIDIKIESTYKSLTFEYLAKQLCETNKVISALMKFILAVIPKAISTHVFSINIGEFIVFARKSN